MKSLFLVGLVGLFSLASVVDVEAGCHRRCGGRHHRHRGCASACQTNYGGCYTGGYTNGCAVPAATQYEMAPAVDAPVDPNAVPPPVPAPAN
ncbi:hypothetical protein NA78x_005863 [Anatilimnocola sp. NA78]|uniref:hypothetical protein n=1 Tax=Anatilimnocola sp. NA78 TaxID=3415683 RepID=UPI003CE498C9